MNRFHAQRSIRGRLALWGSALLLVLSSIGTQADEGPGWGVGSIGAFGGGSDYLQDSSRSLYGVSGSFQIPSIIHRVAPSSGLSLRGDLSAGLVSNTRNTDSFQGMGASLRWTPPMLDRFFIEAGLSAAIIGNRDWEDPVIDGPAQALIQYRASYQIMPSISVSLNGWRFSDDLFLSSGFSRHFLGGSVTYHFQ